VADSYDNKVQRLDPARAGPSAAFREPARVCAGADGLYIADTTTTESRSRTGRPGRFGP